MKKILIILVSMFTILTVWSCKDKFLEFNPPANQFTDAVYFKTANHFNTFIIGAYAEMLGASDWVEVAGFVSQDVRDVGEKRKVLSSYMVPTEGRFKDYWQSMYIINSRANIMLEKLAAAPDSLRPADKVRIEAEARFLRGFGYFNIARAYGNAPLLLKSYSNDQTAVSCTPEDKIWDQVILDLTNASKNLPKRAEWGDANYGRATKGSALAFLANAYMYKKDWANAAKASEDLIALGEYKLAKDERSAFTEALTPENIGETIFEVQFRDGGFEWSNNKQTGSLIGAFTAPRNIGGNYAAFGAWGELVLDTNIRNSMEPTDDRRNMIKRYGDTYKGERMASPFIIGTTADTPQKKVDWSTKYWLGKSGDVTGSNIPLMRYSEFLLNYAEILFEQNKATEAYTQLNAVRKRAKLTDLPVSGDKEVFMTAVMNERRWELQMEPNLWFHYTRTGRVASLRAAQGVAYDTKYNKFPIPQSERDQNPNLCQNTGY